MGLFSPNQNDIHTLGGPRPKTGTSGFERVWNIFTQYTPALLGAGALAAVSSLVYIAGAVFGVVSHALLPVLIACPLGGLLLAPQLCGMADTILRALRGDPDAWWVTYRRAWKGNVKISLLPGLFGGLLFGVQAFILAHAGQMHVRFGLLAAMIAGVVIATAVAVWLLPQLVLMDLPVHRALLNGLLLTARHPLRTLGAVLVHLVYWGLIVLAFPFSAILFLLLTFWFPMLAAVMLIYKPLNETFHIEEELAAREKASGRG